MYFLVIIIIDSVQTPPHDALQNEGSCPKEGQRKWVYYVFVIFLAVSAVLAGVAINRYVMMEKNTNDVEKLLTISKLT